LRDIDSGYAFGLFQRCELTCEEVYVHKMPLALLQSLANESVVSLQIDEANFRPGAAQTVAVRLLERRAGQDCRSATIKECTYMVSQRSKPGITIVIGQGDSLAHFIDIGWRVKVVAIIERPAEILSEQLTYRGFARAGDTHEDDDERFHSRQGFTLLDGHCQSVVRKKAKEGYPWQFSLPAAQGFLDGT
jgi:hypothetical protein